MTPLILALIPDQITTLRAIAATVADTDPALGVVANKTVLATEQNISPAHQSLAATALLLIDQAALAWPLLKPPQPLHTLTALRATMQAYTTSTPPPLLIGLTLNRELAGRLRGIAAELTEQTFALRIGTAIDAQLIWRIDDVGQYFLEQATRADAALPLPTVPRSPLRLIGAQELLPTPVPSTKTIPLTAHLPPDVHAALDTIAQALTVQARGELAQRASAQAADWTSADVLLWLLLPAVRAWPSNAPADASRALALIRASKLDLHVKQ